MAGIGLTQYIQSQWQLTTPSGLGPQQQGEAVSFQPESHSSSRRPLHPEGVTHHSPGSRLQGAHPEGAGLPRCETPGNRMESTNKPAPSPLFVPAGTPDNSPPIHRWGHELLVVRSPGRGDRSSQCGPAPTARDDSDRQILPSLAGLIGVPDDALPPLKRWAIIVCPCRDKELEIPWENARLGSPALKGFHTVYVGVQPLQGWDPLGDVSQGALLRRDPGL